MLQSGASITKTLVLGTSIAAGDRVIDISVQSRSTASRPLASGSPQSPHPSHADTGETLKTLAVSTIEPITFASQVAYRRSSNLQAGLADLATYEDDYWDDSDGGEAHVVTTVSCVGPTGIIIESVKLIRQVSRSGGERHVVIVLTLYFPQDGPHAKVIDSVLDENEEDFLEGTVTSFEDCFSGLLMVC